MKSCRAAFTVVAAIAAGCGTVHAADGRVIQISPSVYMATDFGPSNSAIIIGDEGLIVIDTHEGVRAAQEAHAAYREVTDLPVRAVIYTHAHRDHISGTRVFTGDDVVPVYARANFTSDLVGDVALGRIMRERTVGQFGLNLPANDRTDIGIGPYPRPDGNDSGHVPPSHRFATERESIDVAGVQLELVAAPGETDDQLYVWFPAERVLFPGDNFYAAFPNLYPIRGSRYRDVAAWADSLDKMRAESAKHLVPGHTAAISGESEVSEALGNYAAAIRHVLDETLAGMNAGTHPDKLVESIGLPPELAELPYLQERYGTVAWAVRSIFAGYLGWFDGNPTNLFALAPRQYAEKLADLAGGDDALVQALDDAITEEQFQWALQLTDVLLERDVSQRPVVEHRVTALRALAAEQDNSPARNYYLSQAVKLQGTLDND